MRNDVDCLATDDQFGFPVMSSNGAGEPGCVSNQSDFGISGELGSRFVLEASTNLADPFA